MLAPNTTSKPPYPRPCKRFQRQADHREVLTTLRPEFPVMTIFSWLRVSGHFSRPKNTEYAERNGAVMGAYVKLDVFVISTSRNSIYLQVNSQTYWKGQLSQLVAILEIYDLGLLHGPCCINWHFGRYLANDLLADLFQS